MTDPQMCEAFPRELIDAVWRAVDIGGGDFYKTVAEAIRQCKGRCHPEAVRVLVWMASQVGR